MVTLLPDPFTKTEVENKLKRFSNLAQLDKDVVSGGKTSYFLLMYPDFEGSVYCVKANVVESEDDEGDSLRRQRSKFNKSMIPEVNNMLQGTAASFAGRRPLRFYVRKAMAKSSAGEVLLLRWLRISQLSVIRSRVGRMFL